MALGAIGLGLPRPSVDGGPRIAAIILVPTTLLTIKLYQRLAPPAPPQTTVATSLIGMEGAVEVAVIPGYPQGKGAYR